MKYSSKYFYFASINQTSIDLDENCFIYLEVNYLKVMVYLVFLQKYN